MGNGVVKTSQDLGPFVTTVAPPVDCTSQTSLQKHEVGVTTSLERMKKILGSPLGSRKKSAPQQTQYFGTPLDALLRREDGRIPHLVSKICDYVLTNGLEVEGVFRVSGSARTVDKIRVMFDKTGDADLDEIADVIAIASVLKSFLRELPDGAVSEDATQRFVTAQQENEKDKTEALRKLRSLILTLPNANYDLLKFLCQFLVFVTRHECENKMSPQALAIVFGPNLFRLPEIGKRCGSGFSGLKDQGITNFIVLKFITEYDSLFLEENEVSPYDVPRGQETMKVGVTPPHRAAPPPPDTTDGARIPKRPAPLVPQAAEERSGSAGGSPAKSASGSISSPLRDDESLDTYRSASPFPLDTDRSESILTPRLSSSNMEEVDHVITSVVVEHLFGDSSSDDDATPVTRDDAVIRSDPPIPPPRRKRKEETTGALPEACADNGVEEEEPVMSVKERIQKLTSDQTPTVAPRDPAKMPRQRPKSSAFELFEKQGLIIGMGAPPPKVAAASPEASQGASDMDVDDGRNNDIPSTNNSSTREALSQQEDRNVTSTQDTATFGTLERSQGTLGSFKRAAGPKNRRNPTRSVRRPRADVSEDAPAMKNGSVEVIDLQATNPASHEAEREQATNGVCHVSANTTPGLKPRIGFLNIHGNNSCTDPQLPNKSPDHSPASSTSNKPFVPPLDLSILHEHIEGGDAIPAAQGQSLSLQKTRPLRESDDVVISPRMSKLRKKTNGQTDTDMPPSPPTEQSLIVFQSGTRIGDDEQAMQIKQLTKKIQSCKRKIKLFEEEFEVEHGYRPSQSDKASRPDIKKYMQELARARKELKHCKATFHTCCESYSPRRVMFTFESSDPGHSTDAHRPRRVMLSLPWSGTKEAENEQNAVTMLPTAFLDYRHGSLDDSHSPMSSHHALLDMRHGSLDSRHGSLDDRPELVDAAHGSSDATMEDTLRHLLDKLASKRRDAGRPDDVTLMGRDQIVEEKLAVQKALLHFEAIHGRPATKCEKDLMRPLYDRYRSIKRILAKPHSPADKASDLVPVPEGTAMDFPSPSVSAKSSNRDPIVVPTAQVDVDHDSFMMHDDAVLLTQHLAPSGDHYDDDPVEVRHNVSPSRNLHELSSSELFEEQQRVTGDKRRLRKVLRHFEDDFFAKTGRKVQKDDRTPMQTEYHEYKQIKARLKLLDALLSKHDTSDA